MYACLKEVDESVHQSANLTRAKLKIKTGARMVHKLFDGTAEQINLGAA
jgi:hypothetical protein